MGRHGKHTAGAFATNPMLSTDQYELLDFGRGRKLENWRGFILDRPAPAAQGKPARPELWKQAEAKFIRSERSEGKWQRRKPWPNPWQIDQGDFQLELQPTDFGHVGVFPEHAETWRWIAQQVRRAPRPPKVLHLFAHTGGATLAAAAAGAEVTHVDSARNVVNWARRNAELSGLAEAPIRWIVEDAAKFVTRELKRGNRYQAVILDPPSYGHGPRGEAWKLERSLRPLLEACAELTAPDRLFFLLTCHTTGFGPAELEAFLADCVFGACSAGARAAKVVLKTTDGRQMPSGAAARWPG